MKTIRSAADSQENTRFLFLVMLTLTLFSNPKTQNVILDYIFGIQIYSSMKYSTEDFFYKKCRKAEYVQRRVCFLNVQVPCPHSNVYVKLCNSRLCMKMLSFLFLCTWAMPRISYSSCGIPFPVWLCSFQSEKLFTIFSVSL